MQFICIILQKQFSNNHCSLMNFDSLNFINLTKNMHPCKYIYIFLLIANPNLFNLTFCQNFWIKYIIGLLDIYDLLFYVLIQHKAKNLILVLNEVRVTIPSHLKCQVIKTKDNIKLPTIHSGNKLRKRNKYNIKWM